MTNKITYTQQGDYLLPDLKLPDQPKVEIGVWGKMHLRYIEKYHKIRYTNLFFRLVEQLAEKEGVTERLKADNQMLWVKRMNNIRNRAEEIVNNELIYE